MSNTSSGQVANAISLSASDYDSLDNDLSYVGGNVNFDLPTVIAESTLFGEYYICYTIYLAQQCKFRSVFVANRIVHIYSDVIMLECAFSMYVYRFSRRNGLRVPAKLLVMVTSIAMYAVAAAHFALTVSWLFLDAENSSTALSMGLSCLDNISVGAPCLVQDYLDSVANSTYDPSLQSGNDCAPGALLTVAVSTFRIYGEFFSC